MSWLNDLYLTYEACSSEVGIIKENQPVLLPIAHSTQNAQIEIVINADGRFKEVHLIPKEDAVTVIPVTENSGSRSGSAVYPHPLADKLEYVAGDYVDYVPNCKSDKFPVYIEQLHKWAVSSYALPQIMILEEYLSHKSVMKDLIEAGLFNYSEKGICGEKQQGIVPEDWFVRFSVEIPEVMESRLYCDKEVFDSYVQYYLSEQETMDLCYVSGNIVPCSEKHPSKIRHTGDKAKLISSNDASGIFTYKGRFCKSSQAAMVSYEISQKAHNALRWLIAKQASLRVGEQVFVIWSIENPKIGNVFSEFHVESSPGEVITDDVFAKEVKTAIWGSGELPNQGDSVLVMGVEAATTGRLSIPFYQRYEAKSFLEAIAEWKTGVRWVRRTDKTSSYGQWSPSIFDIVKLTVGDKNDKLNKCMRERLIPCVIEKRKLPYDIVKMALQNAVNPMHFDSYSEWNKGVAITCALLRKWQIQQGNKEGQAMELNTESEDRSYIFGQLLATAEMLEKYSLYKSNGKETRNSAAEKYFTRFQRYPVQTWEIIRNQLQPYIMKLSATGKMFYIEQLDKLSARLDMSDKSKLQPTFLQGYSSQIVAYRDYLKQHKDDKEEE